ncbi:hypothetical protein AAMO2058_001129700 [Amorphochlora amoebiformis]|uniref:Ubiquitin-like domain-containing protein n=1 Tax=Amorphochlora amoebiformis TaxID=1561963 RepID=A0A7S0DCA3_9EUKA|mmetsp:Transcript_23678/g.37251  ORF Transcript_23678/g.37251 Transcript_23678/m.37251 type:complete len:425 (+) Transcript_23678:174-1448(+)
MSGWGNEAAEGGWGTGGGWEEPEDNGGWGNENKNVGWGDEKDNRMDVEGSGAGGGHVEKKKEVVGKPGAPEYMIKVDFEDREVHINAMDMEIKTTTQLYTYLTRKQGLTNDYRLATEDGEEALDREEDTELTLPLNLIVEPEPISLQIQHDGSMILLDQIALNLTIEQVLREYRRRPGGTSLNSLSYEGRRLSENETIGQIGLKNNDVLLGEFSVSIVDNECNKTEEVKVYAYDGPSDLLRKFLDKTRRCNHYGSSLLFEGKELDVSGDGEEQSLFALKIREKSQVTYRSAEFPIKLKDTKFNIEEDLKVMDHFTVKMLKRLYVERAREEKDMYSLAVDDFKLIFGETEMKDEDMLYQFGQYKLKSYSIIHVQHEESKVHTKYRCWMCGELVALRPSDAIRCRHCGGRVVQKLRTRKSMVHIAR